MYGTPTVHGILMNSEASELDSRDDIGIDCAGVDVKSLS